MKQLYKKIVFMVVLLNIFFNLIYGIGNEIVFAAPNANVISKSSISTETMSKEEIMKKYYELKEDNQNLIEKYNKLNGEWSTKKDNIDNRLDSIEIVGKALFAIITFFLGGSLYGIYISIKSKAEKEVNAKVVEEVAEKVGTEVKRIESKVSEWKREEYLMKEKKILVISNSEDEQKKLVDLNLLNKFKKVKYVLLGGSLAELSERDVIIFNGINGEDKKDELETIIKENRNKRGVYFYFKKGRPRFQLDITESINFANSNTTFRGNLLDLMKYQDDVLGKD